MKAINTSLFAIAHITNPFHGGALTNNKEYPVFKIYNGSYGQEIVIINDNGRLVRERACAFTFVTK